MNSIANPHTLTAMEILIKYCNRSLLLNSDFLRGQQNKTASNPKTPIWTSLSKDILFSQSTVGISSPGRHMIKSTTKNQAMPGMNFFKDIFFIQVYGLYDRIC